MKNIIMIFLVVSVLTGCFKNKVECGDESAVGLVHKIITDAAADGMDTQQFNGVNFEPSQIAAYFSRIESKLNTVRTEKSDPDSNKNFCAAEISFTVPSDIINDGDLIRKQMNHSSSDQMARILRVKKEANVVSMEIAYSVQSTDSGDEIVIHLDNVDPMARYLQYITASALIKPILEKQQAEALIQQQKNIEDQQKEESYQACINEKSGAYRAEMGDDVAIGEDQMRVWENLCKPL